MTWAIQAHGQTQHSFFLAGEYKEEEIPAAKDKFILIYVNSHEAMK
jgi:hypothetical protein